jgi:hypothetical protein
MKKLINFKKKNKKHRSYSILLVFYSNIKICLANLIIFLNEFNQNALRIRLEDNTSLLIVYLFILLWQNK